MPKRDEALRLRRDGLSYTEIAKRLDLSPQRIQQLTSPPTAIRKIVVQRAEGRCQECGLMVAHSGHVHHIIIQHEDYNDLDNLILLCVSCHRKAHAAIKPTPSSVWETSTVLRMTNSLTQHCRHCGWGFAPRVPHPKRCPNPKCQKLWPLGEPENRQI